MDAAALLLKQGARKMADLLERLVCVTVKEEAFIRRGILRTFTADMDTPEEFRKMKEISMRGESGPMELSFQPQRFRRTAVSPEEAARRILAHLAPLDKENVPLGDAWKRTLAEPFTAPYAYPPFRRAMMDGYAVRAADLPKEAADEPACLAVLENLQAGKVPGVPVGPGQASRIMTGAMMPEGADTVVMLEMTETDSHAGGSFVRIAKPVPKGRNVADAGSEISAGQLLLAAGRRIGAGETALMAAFGQQRVSVIRQPRVGVISTGSELLDIDVPMEPGKIRDSNTWMLAGLIRGAGGVPVVYGRCPDRKEEVLEKISQGLSECDMLLTTGGVSVGDSDVMAEVVGSGERGGLMLFNKVAMRPGSPTSAAIFDGKLLLALSGNPGACFVGFHLFAAPAIRKLLGCASVQPKPFRARLMEPFTKVNAYARFIRSRMKFENGEVWVYPTGRDQSSLMVTIAGADCLMIIPPLKEPMQQGDWVEVIPLGETEDEPI
jgi:molybdopterin molybdotransferase